MAYHDDDRLCLDLLCPGSISEAVGRFGDVGPGRRNAGYLQKKQVKTGKKPVKNGKKR
jgi:hypothetical protein